MMEIIYINRISVIMKRKWELLHLNYRNYETDKTNFRPL